MRKDLSFYLEVKFMVAVIFCVGKYFSAKEKIQKYYKLFKSSTFTVHAYNPPYR